jgi:hypothetical protein
MVEMVSLGCLSGVGLWFMVGCFGSLVVWPWDTPFWRWGMGVLVLLAVCFVLLFGVGVNSGCRRII